MLDHGLSEQTFSKWKRTCGAMDVSEVKRLRALEKENARLKRLVAELTLGQVNPKRVYRIWREQGWQRRRPARRRAKHAGDASNACHIRRAEYGDHAWAIDVVMDRTRDGKPLKILTVLDEYTREALAIEVRRVMGQREVGQILARWFEERGVPEFVRSDHGGEFAGDPIRGAHQRSGTSCARALLAKRR